MAPGRWRILVAIIFLIPLIHESVAPRIKSSRRRWDQLRPFRARVQQENDVRGGKSTTIINPQTSSTPRSTSTTIASTSSVTIAASSSTQTAASETGSSIPTISSTTTPTVAGTPFQTTLAASGLPTSETRDGSTETRKTSETGSSLASTIGRHSTEPPLTHSSGTTSRTTGGIKGTTIVRTSPSTASSTETRKTSETGSSLASTIGRHSTQTSMTVTVRQAGTAVPDVDAYRIQNVGDDENIVEVEGDQTGGSAPTRTSTPSSTTTGSTSTVESERIQTTTETEITAPERLTVTESGKNIVETEKSTMLPTTAESSVISRSSITLGEPATSRTSTSEETKSTTTTGSRSTTTAVLETTSQSITASRPTAVSSTASTHHRSIPPESSGSTAGSTLPRSEPATENDQEHETTTSRTPTTVSETSTLSSVFPPLSADGSSRCPGFVEIDDSCYAAVSGKYNWLAANDACSSLDVNAHLAVASSAQKRAAVQAVMTHLDENICSAAWTSGQRANPDSASAPVVWKRDVSMWKLPSSSERLKVWQTPRGGCLLVRLEHGGARWRIEECATEACVICEFEPQR